MRTNYNYAYKLSSYTLHTNHVHWAWNVLIEMSFTNQIRLYKWLYFDLAASLISIPLIPSLIPSLIISVLIPTLILALIIILAGPTFRTTTQVTWMTLCSWHRLGNGLTKMYSTSNIMQLTWIGQLFGWDVLWVISCDWYRSGNSLVKTHSASDNMRLDKDRIRFWPRRTVSDIM